MRAHPAHPPAYGPECTAYENAVSCPFRVIAMSGVLLMQAWLAWNFIRFQIKRWRENASPVASPKKREPKKKGKKENNKKKKEDIGEESEEAETDERVNETKSSSGKLKRS